MKTIKVSLFSNTDVKDFVNIVSRYDFDIDLVSGRYVVDAKSIMGIFSLNLRSPITLVAHSENAEEFFARIEGFIVK